jgi:sulfur relay (sulfurtransferase) complex TusBCD TusD component (DsrE family)
LKRLGLVLSHGPGSREARWALELARAAHGSGIAVHVFLMDEGVRLPEAPFWRELADATSELAMCGTSCERLGVKPPEGVELGSQVEHATLVRRCDRVVALT